MYQYYLSISLYFIFVIKTTFIFYLLVIFILAFKSDFCLAMETVYQCTSEKPCTVTLRNTVLFSSVSFTSEKDFVQFFYVNSLVQLVNKFLVHFTIVTIAPAKMFHKIVNDYYLMNVFFIVKGHTGLLKTASYRFKKKKSFIINVLFPSLRCSKQYIYIHFVC